MIPLVRPAVTGLIVLLCTVTANGQMFSYGGLERRSTQSLSATAYKIDFTYDGAPADGGLNRLDLDGWAYGLTFDRRNFSAAIVFGSARSPFETVSGNLHLVDASLSGWGEIVRTGGSTAGVGLPIVIHSGFRNVDGDFTSNQAEAFSYTMLGLGTGLTFEAEPSPSVNIQAHAWPVIGMVFRSFEGFAGSSTLIDSDVQVHLMNLFGRYGISVGYGYRWQKWNTNDVVLTTNVERDVFDYKSKQHMLRLGLNW